MITILAMVGYYLPGHKSGGPVRSMANLVAGLADQIRFKLVTTDRDLGDTVPYPGIDADHWTEVGPAAVYYAAPGSPGFGRLRALLSEESFDVLYLNSFFYQLTIKVLILRRLRLVPDVPVLLAPRGEFAAGALGLSARKKRLYLLAYKVMGLGRKVHFQASTPAEARDIEATLGRHVDGPIHVASDLAGIVVRSEAAVSEKRAGRLSVVFLSRIAPVKNLDFALAVLAELAEEVRFEIYGPLEDQRYWEACQTRIAALPGNVTVHYHGEVGHEGVAGVLAKHDVFFLPTQGENFGHAILEALAAACPVVVSDRTPWNNVQAAGAGVALALEDRGAFVEALKRYAAMDATAHEAARQRAQAYARDYLEREAREARLKNLAMFEQVKASGSCNAHTPG